VGPPTLRQCVPFARDTVVRTWLPRRHEGEAGSAREIDTSVCSQANVIRQRKCNRVRLPRCEETGRRKSCLWITSCTTATGAYSCTRSTCASSPTMPRRNSSTQTTKITP
jgi:hypothetical protein